VKSYRVEIEQVVRGYVFVDANSKSEAKRLAAQGYYDDIFGEERVGPASVGAVELYPVED
jgi:hypothetical protein